MIQGWNRSSSDLNSALSKHINEQGLSSFLRLIINVIGDTSSTKINENGVVFDYNIIVQTLHNQLTRSSECRNILTRQSILRMRKD
jgi:hypothetical protein